MRALLLSLVLIAASLTIRAQWSQQFSSSTEVMRGIHFSDATHGYLAMDRRIYKTSNGGSAWASAGFFNEDTVQQNYKSMRAVHSFSADDAIVCGLDYWSTSAMILRTTTGGLDWDTAYFGPPLSELNDLHFTPTLDGHAVGNNGLILTSSTGGFSWSEQNSGTSATLHGVFFRSPSNGMAVGEGIILRTTDAGNTWQPTTVTGTFRGIEALDATTWMASGDFGTVLLSEDGGDTWQDRSLPLVDPDLNRLCVFDGNSVYVGGDANIYVTHDRGLIWEHWPLPPAVSLITDIYTSSALGGTGYACTLFGSVYKTINTAGPERPIIACVPDTLGACVGTSVFFDNLSYTVYTTKWKLDGTLVSTAHDGDITFPAAGSHQVRMVVSNGTYADSLTFTVQVSAGPFVAPFSINSPATLCAGQGFGGQFSVPNSQSGMTYELLVNGVPTGTPLNGTGGTILFNFSGAQMGQTFAIRGSRTNACGTVSHTTNATTVVIPSADPNTQVDIVPAVLCAPGPVVVHVYNSEPGFNYRVRLGTSSVSGTQTGNGGTLTFSLGNLQWSNTYNVYVTNPQGNCPLQLSTLLTLTYAPVGGAFTISNPFPLVGETVNVTSATATDAYSWNFGSNASPETSTEAQPSFDYTAAGPQQIVALMSNAAGCTDTITLDVNVGQQAPDLDGEVCWAQLTGIQGATNYSQSKRYVLDSHRGSDGTMYICGYIYSSIGGGNNVYGMFFTKLDPNGNVAWDKLVNPATSVGTYRGTFANTITTDADGNVYVGGTIAAQNFQLGTWTLTQTSAAHCRGYIAKFSPAGDFVWVIYQEDPGATNYQTGISSIAYLDDQHLYAIPTGISNELIQPDGNTVITTDVGQDAIARFNTSGVVLSYSRFGQYSNYGGSGMYNPDPAAASTGKLALVSPRIKIGPAGKLIISSILTANQGDAFFGSDTLDPVTVPNFFVTGYVARYDTASGWDGAFRTWASSLGTSSSLGLNILQPAFTPDNDGNVAISRGWTSYAVGQYPHFMLGDGTVLEGDSGSVTMLYDPDGNLLWHQRHARFLEHDLEYDGERFWALGRHGRSMLLDEAGASICKPGTGGHDLSLFRFDDDGVIDGISSFSSTGFDQGSPLMLHPCGGVQFIGLASADREIDGVQLHGTDTELYALRFASADECVLEDCPPIILALDQPGETAGYSAYPNPSKGTFTFTGTGLNRVDIVDVQGRVVESIPCSHVPAVWDASQAPPGVYLARAWSFSGVSEPFRLIRIE